MIEAYLKTKPLTKIVGLIVPVLLVALASWRFGYDTLFLTVALALVLLVFHFSVTYTSNVAAAVVTIGQTFFVLAFTSGLEDSFYSLELVLGIDVALLQLLSLSVGVCVIASYMFFSYYFAHGRMWVNLFVSFLLFNGVSTPIWAFNTANLILGLTVGYLAGAAYLFMRSRTTNKNRKVVEKQTLNGPLKKRALNIFKELDLTVDDMRDETSWYGTHYLAYNKNAVYAVHMLTVREGFSITKRGIFADGKEVSSVIESLKNDVLKHHKEIPTHRTTAVVIVPADSALPEGTVTVNISKWKQPDHKLGAVLFVTPNRFKRFAMKQSKGSEMSQKDLKKLNFK